MAATEGPRECHFARVPCTFYTRYFYTGTCFAVSVETHRLCHKNVEVGDELVDRVVSGVIGDDLGERLAEHLGHLSLKITAYTQALVDELIGTQARIFDHVILIAVVDDVHIV